MNNKKAIKAEAVTAKQENQEAHVSPNDKGIDIIVTQKSPTKKKAEQPLSHKLERKKDQATFDTEVAEGDRELTNMRHDLDNANAQAVKKQIKNSRIEHEEADVRLPKKHSA